MDQGQMQKRESPIRALLPTREKVRGWRVRVLTVALAAIPPFVLAIAVHRLPASLTRPNSPADWWMLVQGVAAVMILGATLALGIVGWYGLRSLRLARQDMVIRATREARELALERAEQFSQMVLRGEHSGIQDALEAAKVAPFTAQVPTGAAIFDDETDKMHSAARKWWATVPGDVQERIIFFLNDLEAWAMYFMHELADGDVVFGPCAPTFCSIVVQYAPWIIVVRKDQYAGFYPNIVGLFKAWRAELDAQDRGSQTEAWARAAKAAQERRAKHRLPRPLGTQVDM